MSSTCETAKQPASGQKEQQERRLREKMGERARSRRLAAALAQAGHTVALLNVDIHGPNIPRLVGLDGRG